MGQIKNIKLHIVTDIKCKPQCSPQTTIGTQVRNKTYSTSRYLVLKPLQLSSSLTPNSLTVLNQTKTTQLLPKINPTSRNENYSSQMLMTMGRRRRRRMLVRLMTGRKFFSRFV